MLRREPTPQTPRGPANTNIRDLITVGEVINVLAQFFGELSRGIAPNRATWRSAAPALVLAERWGLAPHLDERELA